MGSSAHFIEIGSADASDSLLSIAELTDSPGFPLVVDLYPGHRRRRLER